MGVIMDKMLKNQRKMNKYDNIVNGVIAPLLIYYVIHNASVIGGLSALEWLVSKEEMPILILNEEILFYLKTIIKMAGMALGGLAVYPYYKREQSMEMKKSLSLKAGMALIFIGALLSLGVNFLFMLTGLPQSNEQYQQVAKVQFALPLWLAFGFYGIISPIVEEIVFRGIACGWLGRKLSQPIAVAGSALLFGAFHGNLVQMLYASIMGVVLAYVYQKYQNLKAPVLVHAAANVAIYFLTYFF